DDDADTRSSSGEVRVAFKNPEDEGGDYEQLDDVRDEPRRRLLHRVERRCSTTSPAGLRSIVEASNRDSGRARGPPVAVDRSASATHPRADSDRAFVDVQPKARSDLHAAPEPPRTH